MLTTNIFILVGVIILVCFLAGFVIMSRYVKCKPDELLVKYGKTSNKTKDDTIRSAQIIHGKGTFVIPFFQSYATMSLKPLQMTLDFKEALSSDNIRVNVPTNLTVAIDTKPEMMQTAAERLLNMDNAAIQKLVSEVIYGQMRIIIAKMTIPELNADREKFQKLVEANVTNELIKYGLKLLNINIIDIRDTANIIVNMGKEAAARVDNEAQFRMAEQDKLGKSRVAEQQKEKEILIANTTKEQQIQVAEAEAEQKSKVAEANKNKDINVAEAEKLRISGIEKAKAEKDAAVAEAESLRDIRQAEARKKAEVGKNLAQQEIAKSEAQLAIEQEDARRIAGEAKVKADTEVAIEQEKQNKKIEEARAIKVEQMLKADKIVPAEIEKKEKVLKAEATADALKTEADGFAKSTMTRAEAEAKAIQMKGEAEAKAREALLLAEAEGKKQSLLAEAEAYKEMLKASEVNPDVAIQFKMVEKINYNEIAKEQAKAFEKMNLGTVNIYDTGNGKTAPQFMKGLVDTIAPSLGAVNSIPMPGNMSNWLQNTAGLVAGAAIGSNMGNIPSEGGAPLQLDSTGNVEVTPAKK